MLEVKKSRSLCYCYNWLRKLTILAVFWLQAYLAQQVWAASFYTAGHTDIAVGYDPVKKILIPFWNLDSGNMVDGQHLPIRTVFAPEDLIAEFSNTRSAPAGSSSYLGVAPGTPIYMGGPSSNWQPYLGFGADSSAPENNAYGWEFQHLDPTAWVVDPYPRAVGVRLIDWSAPVGGNFALYTTNTAGTSTTDIFFSTYNPSTANIDGLGLNSWYLLAGGHEHYTFGFTTPGEYSLTLEFWGEHNVDGFKSATGTFTFLVAPEPSVSGLMIISGAALLLTRRRKATSSSASLSTT